MKLFKYSAIIFIIGLIISGFGLRLHTAHAQGELQTNVKSNHDQNKVAFLVKDDRMLRSSLMSVVQMLQGEGYPAAKATIVVIGPALKSLKKGSDAESEVNKALSAGVKIDACEVAMKHMDITPDQLIEGVNPVDNGFFQVFRLQKQGYQTLTL